MADILWSDVTAIAPELTTVDDQARVRILTYVNGTRGVDPAVFDGEDGPTTRLARIFLAAHLGAGVGAGASGAAGGPVTSESAGGLSRSYGTITSSVGTTGELGSTYYGRMFDALVGRSMARLPMVL